MNLHLLPHKGLCLVLALALVFSGALVPARALAWGEFTLKEEKELGQKFNLFVRSRLPLVQDVEIVDYVESIVRRLTRATPPQLFPFSASVIRHNAVNAFACPGGYIFVHTGLILAMDNESEVAGVIAHEMAHVTQRHIASRIESSQYISILSLLGALAGAFLGGGGQGSAALLAGSMAAGQAAMLNYSRNDEREADQVGMNYLTKSGYPPQGMVRAFEVLSRKQWLMGSDIPSYLSTHPGLLERVRDMSMRISRLPEAQRVQKDDNSRFLRVQALIRARYSDPAPAAQAFAKQMNGANRCIALMGMGILCSRQNRINDASDYFAQALACAPADPLIVREAGRFHYTKGDRNKGTALLDRAVAMNPNDTFALFYRAKSLDDAGRTTEAIRYAKNVLEKVPEDSEVHEMLARLYGKNHKMFFANLHMAYSGLYDNNKKKSEQFKNRAESLAKSPDEQHALERFLEQYEEREEFWE
ncbi:M48 family metalloprotease [Desulfovibrio sp. OttesenSCG-928-F20]|nr:M48 family metalloprotease [Desulfovibrio sp. OttesenSCG-928-F20]